MTKTYAEFQHAWRELATLPAGALLNRDERDLVHLTLERYWNDGSPSGHSLGMPIRWAPASPAPSFRIPIILAPADLVTVVEDLSEASILVERASNAFHQVFALHPRMRNVLAKQHLLPGDRGSDSQLRVVPTSSGRTVAVLDTSGFRIKHYLKLAYPDTLGRFGRDLSLFKWMGSFERNRMFLDAIGEGNAVRLFPEGSGSYLELMGVSHGVGFLLRSMPMGHNPDEHLMVPAFSLWAAPASGDQTILDALVRKLGWTSADARHFLIDNVVDTYLYLAVDHGLMPELNAQNLLFVIGKDGSCIPCLRDMQDVFVDDVIRARRGLSVGGVAYKRLNVVSPDIRERRSFSFDFKLGEYILDPLTNIVGRNDRARREIRQGVREKVRQKLVSHPDYWPSDNTWFRYANKLGLSRFDYDRHERPRWR